MTTMYTLLHSNFSIKSLIPTHAVHVIDHEILCNRCCGILCGYCFIIQGYWYNFSIKSLVPTHAVHVIHHEIGYAIGVVVYCVATVSSFKDTGTIIVYDVIR
jgi:hypothetical protein